MIRPATNTKAVRPLRRRHKTADCWWNARKKSRRGRQSLGDKAFHHIRALPVAPGSPLRIRGERAQRAARNGDIIDAR
jgi:hypothetical protein